MDPAKKDTTTVESKHRKRGGMHAGNVWRIAAVVLGCVVVLQLWYMHTLSVKAQSTSVLKDLSVGLPRSGFHNMFTKYFPFKNEKINVWTNPFEEMKMVERMFDDLDAYPPIRGFSYFTNRFMPRMDIQDKGGYYLISADIPGVEKENISVDVHDNILTVEGERKADSSEGSEGKGYFRKEISYGTFHESFTLPADVNADDINAEYNKGVLKIRLGKKSEGLQESKKVPIKVVGTGQKV